MPGGQFTINDKIPSTDQNFVSYRKTFNGQEVMLELYRPGSANTELALTYASLGRWSTSIKNGTVVAENSRVYLAYGLETPARLLSAKTGTGHYAGVVHGAGANRLNGATYDVTGTSRFDVDFSNQRYSEALPWQALVRTAPHRWISAVMILPAHWRHMPPQQRFP